MPVARADKIKDNGDLEQDGKGWVMVKSDQTEKKQGTRQGPVFPEMTLANFLLMIEVLGPTVQLIHQYAWLP